MGWETERAIALIAGPSGSGKTWFVANLPNAVLYDTDIGGGASDLEARIKRNGSERKEVSTFAEILADLKLRRESGRIPKSVIIDHVTGLHQNAVVAANPSGEKDYGRSSDKATASWRVCREFLRSLDCNIFATAHLKGLWKDEKQIGEVTDGAKNIEADMKIVLHLERGRSRPDAKNPSIARVIKWRRDAELDPRGEVPAAFPFTLAKFAEIAGAGFARESKPEPLASAAQIAEVRRLLAVVKVPEGKADRTVTYLAGASDEQLAEATAAEAVRAIDYLNKLIAPPAQKGSK